MIGMALGSQALEARRIRGVDPDQRDVTLADIDEHEAHLLRADRVRVIYFRPEADRGRVCGDPSERFSYRAGGCTDDAPRTRRLGA
jgi:hypothetical protein